MDGAGPAALALAERGANFFEREAARGIGAVGIVGGSGLLALPIDGGHLGGHFWGLLHLSP